MALGDVLVQGSYSVIKKISFDKQDREVCLLIVVYASPEKTTILANFDTRVICDTSTQCEVISKDVASPPESPVAGDKYLIPASASGDWSGKEGLVLYWSASNSWEELPETVCVKAMDEGRLYFKSSSGWVFDHGRLTATEFDDWFSVSAVGGDGNNILKRAYQYLKTRPEFAGATDL